MHLPQTTELNPGSIKAVSLKQFFQKAVSNITNSKSRKGVKMYTFVASFPIPIDHLEIGTFVTNAYDPLQEKFTPSNLKAQIAETEVHTYSEHLNTTNSQSIQALFTKYLSASVSDNNDHSTTLSSLKTASYKMVNSTSWFQQACSDPSTRRWLEEQIGRDSDVYLLVGSQTLFDGNVEVTRKQDAHRELGVKVPVDKIMGIPAGLDTRGNASSTQNVGSTRKFTTQGESIWALQYRKIKFKWFFSKAVDQAFLEKGSRWKIVGERSEENDDEEDVVEAIWEDDDEVPGGASDVL